MSARDPSLPARRKLPPSRLAVLCVALGLFGLWLALHLNQLTATQDGWIRFVLTFAFCLLLMFRPKPGHALPSTFPSAHASVLVAIPGTALVLMGLIMGVQQSEWIGILLILWGCLRWSLPAGHRPDTTLALLLLYWAHPIPGQIFGPLQLAMQHLSVRGTEWLLLGLDVRVWADGLVLRTGFSTYEVPTWCSGMRTATTVFLLGWGLALLNRFRLWECALTVLAALFQALLLNILRIATMVVCVPRLFDMSQIEYLHDTAGLIVLAAVFLVYLEINLWRRWRQSLNAPHADGYLDHQIEHPPDWWHLRRSRWAVISVVLFVGWLTLTLYRNGPQNRLAVLKDVATASHDSDDHEEALHLAQTVLIHDPADTEWHLKSIRLLLTLRRYNEVLTETVRVRPLDETQIHERDVLRAYALMALERLDEAAAIVQILPDEIRRANPRVAMILAVMAFRRDDPDGVADNIKLAARWKPNMDRVRLMYPYLRKHRKWQAIADTDSPEPHRKPESIFSAIEAYMNLDQAPKVARLTLRAVATWPGDPRVLEPLFYMASKRPGSDWEARFREQLRLCADGLRSPDAIYPLFDKCFELGRPDLAWYLYRRIHALDPTHPTLPLSLARFGNQWFAFRRRSLGIPSPTPMNTIDLSSAYQAGRLFPEWRSLLDWIPEGNAMAAPVPQSMAARQRFLDAALREFETRAAQSTLTPPMRYLYARALELAGRRMESRTALRQIATDAPDESRTVDLALSEMYERAGDWQNVYETLRTAMADVNTGLTPLLRFGRATVNLRLNVAALHTACEIHRRYPRSAQADALLASALLQTGAPDEALSLIDQPRPRHIRELDLLRAQALFVTQRFTEADAFCHAVLLAHPPVHADTPQRFVLPPAELSHLWHQAYVPSAPQFEKNADVLRQNLAASTNPFLKSMMTAWLACYAARGASNTTSLANWEQTGRDPLERAVALNQLTLLLCRFGRLADARDAAVRASELLPESPLLLRWEVALTGVDTGVLARARAQCPHDPELWLAELVHAARTEPARATNMLAELQAPGSPVFPAETITRAGEYLRRQGLTNAGTLALRDATRRAAGLLPIYLLGLRCAMADGDRDWATTCTRLAIASALRPPTTLYRKMVDLKTANGEPEADFDMVEALKNLRQNEPDNLLWAQMLGYVRFKRGGWEVLDAYSQMDAALTRGATNKLTFIIAAESARLLENHLRATEILRQGLEWYPGDRVLLNNLAYGLSHMPDGQTEAGALVPQLLALDKDDPQILDTVAGIYVAAGKTQEARDIIERLLAHTKTGEPLWFRARLHDAALLAATNNMAGALGLLDDALAHTTDLPDEDVMIANRLQAQWENRRLEAEAAARPPPAPDVLTPTQTVEALATEDLWPIPPEAAP